ncbi:TetR/AcrR family transcriptional regulator [Tenggerimyces flavus]|uniref:TetR/AcrR family transcriptional regulator n=1 Tax=Tenggerimyces flavus TaxID=1708749 RepID=A0ABV7Y1X5_9ACTN|nr:TetR/AcrR family transcriptional regulator [Tenggerimyces flavus]MBM7790894.1 AcrR family transcriptional regulator [Tenggerimyces flavus]
MARPRSTDTRDRIQAAAMELFLERGVQRTSLQDIAGRLGITKPALYYHFDSREALVRSLVQPLVDEFEAFLAEREAGDPLPKRELIGVYFDLTFRNRHISQFILRDLSTLHLVRDKFEGWRTRMMLLLMGPTPTVEERVAAIVAIGGMADTTVMFPDLPADDLRAAAVKAACATLGLPPDR